MPLTKLVCTIGPASSERLDELVAAGMDVARLNLSHGTDADHLAAATAVRAAADDAGATVAIMADLPGPKIRLGQLPDGELELEGGTHVTLGPGKIEITYPALADDVDAGDRLMLADGAVELRVLRAKGTTIETEVVRGGTIRSGAGLNAPSERLGLPAVTDRDRQALSTVRQIAPDFVAQSFVRRAADLQELRALLGAHPLPIVAKIETRAAIEHLDEILDECDALMLARGDLGVEIPFAEVPLIQKRVIDAAVAAGVPVIVATQMLESMVSAQRPTRAEASDVANAVLDGTDAVMLSAETAIGGYPVLAADAAVSICRAAESDPARTRRSATGPTGIYGEPGAIAAAAVELARTAGDLPVAGIACFTRSGLTARLLARLRPSCPITALSPDPAVVRRLALLRGVRPIQAAAPGNTDEIIRLLDHSLQKAGLPDGAHVVLVASTPFGAAKTNFLKLHRLGT